MPRTTLTVQEPGIAGATATRNAVDASNGNQFVWPNGPVMLNVRNTNAATRTLTLKANGNLAGGLSVSDKTYAIAASTADVLILISNPLNILQSDGFIYLDWSAATNVDISLAKAV